MLRKTFLEELRKQDHIKTCSNCGHTRYMHIKVGKIYANGNTCAEKDCTCPGYPVYVPNKFKKFPKKKSA